MSTITCTNFFPKVQLSSYEDGRFLLTAHGPFLELYDLDKFHSDDFDARECEPIRTRVFEKSKVQCFAILKSGHVLAITSEYNRSKLNIQGCIVHRDLLLTGGYADTTTIRSLVREKSRTDAYFMAAIAGTNEILLLTEYTLTHFRFGFEDESNVVYDIIEKFTIQSLLPPNFANKRIDPLAVDSSTDYAILMSIGDSMVLLKYSSRERNKWSCRDMHDPKGSLLGKAKVMIIPDIEIAVVLGRFYTKFISISYRQSGVSKDQLRVLYCDAPENHIKQGTENIEIEETRAFTFTIREGVAHIYLIRDQDLTLWKVHKQTVTLERTFVHSKDDIEELDISSREKTQERAVINGKETVTYKRTTVNTPKKNSIRFIPLTATIMRRKTGTAQGELLVISFKSGRVKVLRTSDIIKDPVCTYMSLGQKNKPVENLFPCWDFPLNPLTPLTQLIGLSNGMPIVFLLKAGSWNLSQTPLSKNKKYSQVCSKVTLDGCTVSVFYNRNDICFSLFQKRFYWKEDRLNCEIVDCIISFFIVAIITRAKIVFFDIRGIFNSGENFAFDSAAVDYESFDAEVNEISKGLVSEMLCAKSSNDDMTFCTVIFKGGFMRSLPLIRSLRSSEPLLQEIYDSQFNGKLDAHSITDGNYMDTAGDIQGNFFNLQENGVLHTQFYINGTARKYAIDLKEARLLPQSAKLLGFISIYSTDIHEHSIYVLARSKDGDFLYLKEPTTIGDSISEPVISKFLNTHIFGHFVGPKEHGRCVLYSTSTRKYGEPELMRVEVRLSHARKREDLVLNGSLSQANSVVKLVNISDLLDKRNTIIVSSCLNKIELYELNRKGRITLKKTIELVNEKEELIYVSSFDTYYVKSTCILYIVAVSSCEEMTLITWNSLTNEHTYETTTSNSPINEVLFIGNEHSTDPPRLIACINSHLLMVHQLDSEVKYEKELEHILFRFTPEGTPDFNGTDSKVFAACTGDGKEVHDVWIVGKREAILYSGRNSKVNSKPQTHKHQSPIVAEVKSISAFSTRNGNAEGVYANVVFVVTELCQIGVLASLQTFEQPPAAIHFLGLCSYEETDSIALHAELLNYSVHNSIEFDVNFRLFIAGSNSIHIRMVTLRINSAGIRILYSDIKEDDVQGDITTTTSYPSHFVVSQMDTPDRATPKYGIIAGSEGTETVRICASKLSRSAAKED